MVLICFSHLRWDFVYQRPQHLLARFNRLYPVFYIEEPFFDAPEDTFSIKATKEGVSVVHYYLEGSPQREDVTERQKKLTDLFINANKIDKYILWYYTPMSLQFSKHLQPQLTVFDCMDELSAFRFAPPILKQLEEELLQKADVVFTGGYSLYEAKKNRHSNIHPFPSSIDKVHFAQARKHTAAADQEDIPHPRLGFYGVLDERLDLELIHYLAEHRPAWQLILIGPVVKIDPNTLPKLPNIHYLGGRSYDELPAYLAGWDVAMICFAINESTKYISPTKTPEYLAAGKPVVSAAIQDVINPYGDEDLVRIAYSPQGFLKHAEEELNKADKSEWLKRADAFLKNVSWDKTCEDMAAIMTQTMNEKKQSKNKESIHV